MIRKRIQDIEFSIRKISKKAGQQEGCVRWDIGQPSFDTPDHVKEAAKAGLDEPQGYTATEGIEELRRLIAREESNKKGISRSSEDVMVSTGGTGALQCVFGTLLGEEDKAVFNDPCWGPYKLLSKVNGNRFTQVKYFENGELRQEAREEIKNATAVVVNTPSNPEGRVLEKPEAKEIAEVAEDHDTFLISDDVYHRLTFGKKHYSPAAFTDKSAVIGSSSKNHAMTGWRIGWVVAKPELVNEFTKVNRVTTAAPNKVGQLATVEALKNDSHVEEMRQEYQERRDLVVERMEQLGWSFKRPEGAIYAFPEVERDSWSFCLDMVEKGVAMVPGEPFGPESDQNVRISFGSTEKEELERGFDILEEELY